MGSKILRRPMDYVEMSFQLKPTFSSRVSQPCMCDSYCASCGIGTGLQTQEGFPSDKCVFKTQTSIVSIIFPCLVGYSCPGTYYRIHCNTMQYDAIHNKYNKYNTNTIQLQYNSTQFNRIQCDTILYIYHHIYYHILCMYISIYIFTYIQYPIQKLSLPQLIGWQLRLKRNSGPSGAEWDWQGRSFLSVDFDLLLRGDNQQCLGFSSGHHGDFMGNPKKWSLSVSEDWDM